MCKLCFTDTWCVTVITSALTTEQVIDIRSYETTESGETIDHGAISEHQGLCEASNSR